jgi:tRNA threonylcarbamoyladenosine biosynthesis protein TsaE
VELIADFISRNTEETLSYARKLAHENFPRGSVILLEGGVGTGKTTFVRGFVSEWELENNVTSPTFTLMNEYRNDKIRICHFDFYRLNSLEEIMELGIEDYLSNCDFSFIEWPDIGEKVLDFATYRIILKIGSAENERLISIKSP